MNTAVQVRPLSDPTTEIPISRRLPYTEYPTHKPPTTGEYDICTPDECTVETVRSLWNGKKVLFQHSKIGVKPDRIVISRSKRKDYPVLICRIFHCVPTASDLAEFIVGFAAFPRPVHAESYEQAGEFSRWGGPSTLMPGSIGSVTFKPFNCSENGQSAGIAWLQGSISPKMVWDTAGHSIITPSTTRRYFNWDIKLVNRLLEFFRDEGFQFAYYDTQSLSSRQFERQLKIFRAAAAQTGYALDIKDPPLPSLRHSIDTKIIEVKRQHTNPRKQRFSV